MSESAPDARVVAKDCIAWSTKASGKPDGGASSRPIPVPRETRVVVEGVALDVAPRSLLVRVAEGSGPLAGTRLEIREAFLG